MAFLACKFKYNIARTTAGRRSYIFGATGQAGLITQVSVFPNTQLGMDAIVDGR